MDVNSEIKRLRSRSILLEKLLTGSAAARPPGAAGAVARLPSPAVSVILPTFNRACFVGDAIESVIAQTFKNWELIVVDDGSADGSAETIGRYLSDSRIRYVRQENAGAAAARNRGLAISSAPFVAYLDSDNVYYPDFLGRAVEALATNESVDILFGALVTASHNLKDQSILFESFDRARLTLANFIDTNVIVHRRALVDRYGAWDASLKRFSDWDLVMRYTAEKPACQLFTLAANYRVCDKQRITDTVTAGPDLVRMKSRFFPPRDMQRRPRVLCAVWHYPHLSETYVETELQCLKKWGVHIEIWREGPGRSPYPIDVAVHDGSLADAVAKVRPDIIHVHWLEFGHGQAAALAATGLPVTLRLHGFDTTRGRLVTWLDYHWAEAVYAFPSQIASLEIHDDRLRPMPVQFSADFFRPQEKKDKHLVVRTAAALPGKDLEIVLQVAKRLPEFRFVLAVVTPQGFEDYVEQLKRAKAELDSPAELIFDVPRAEISELVAQAGIYLHTMKPIGTDNATPVGQPISIAEAMATGCYCLTRDVPELAELVGSAGATYRDDDHLVALLTATQQWSNSEWESVRQRSVERAHANHADTLVLRQLFLDWMRLSDKARTCQDEHYEASKQVDAAEAGVSRSALTNQNTEMTRLLAAQARMQREIDYLSLRLEKSEADAEWLAGRSKVTALLGLAAPPAIPIRDEYWSTLFGEYDPEIVALCQVQPEDALTLVLLYRIVLGRSPDAQGMRFFIEKARLGRSEKRIVGDLLASDEYRALRLGSDWWRRACKNADVPAEAPRRFHSPASFYLNLAKRERVRRREIGLAGMSKRTLRPF